MCRSFSICANYSTAAILFISGAIKIRLEAVNTTCFVSKSCILYIIISKNRCDTSMRPGY